jgi:stress-induced morphogen
VSAAVLQAIESAVTGALPAGTKCVATGGDGHYTIEVVSSVFAGKSMLESQRLVYRALGPLLAGEAPPIHAVDKLITKTP